MHYRWGVQGLGQIEAVSQVMKMKSGLVYDISNEQAERIVKFAKERLSCDFDVSNSPEQLASKVDVLITSTTSTQPLFNGSIIKPGTHINAIGSNMPSRRELDVEILRRSKVVVDSLDQAPKESGDLVQPISHGEYDVGKIHSEIGDVISGRKLGRVTDDEITLFKSVGIAVEDIAVARRIYELAVKQGIGAELTL